MKVLLVAIFLVALVVLASAGWECTEEKVKRMCGPEGAATNKLLMEKMGKECASKLSHFEENSVQICTDYNSDKDWNKCCEAKKRLIKDVANLDGAEECFAKLTKQ